MSNEWVNDKFGRFLHDGIQWEKELEVPAFNIFTYKAAYEKPNGNSNIFSLIFDAEEDIDIPTDEAIKLASTVLKNQELLVSLSIEALWNDLKGIGRKSGMWWHGSFNEAFEESEIKPTTSNELVKYLKFSSIIIHNATETDTDPVIAELAFHAEFEEEHGVGILTDGKAILGTGYMITVDQYLK